MIKSSIPKVVSETIEIWERYRNNARRVEWANQVQEDREFRYSKQWTQDQIDELTKRGQAPIVVNRIHPAVETAKALLTNNRPSFRVSPREDSDNETAQAINGLLEYIWYISEGNAELRDIIDHYYVDGLGAALAYQDSLDDNGAGEVKIMSLDPLELYFDPSGRNRYGDDFENIIYSRLYTKSQAKKWKPLYDTQLDSAVSSNESDRPQTNRADSGETSFPEEPMIMDQDENEYIRGYERYTMIASKRFRVFESFSGKEELLKPDEFKRYIMQPAWIINGKVILDPQIAEQQVQILEQQNMALMAQGQAPMQSDAQQITYGDLLKMGHIQVVNVNIRIIRQICVMGDKLLYERELPDNLHYYPIVLFMNLHTGTPFPLSDVRLARPLQEYINKIRSLIIAHAATSTNVKVLLPKGSIDKEDFETQWARPGVGIEVDFDLGEPKPVHPVPLPNELYHNEITAKNDIDHLFGLYEMSMGDTSVAPDTYKATIALDEFGQRRIKSKLADIEGGLTRLGKVIIPLMQQLYTKEKIIRLIQPNNSMSEYAINKRLYDDKGRVIDVLNDISRGNYDMIVVSGSTLPTNRYAQLEIYMKAYSMGIIDRQEVLKKTEIFDMEGVLQRTDVIQQLEQQVEQSLNVIKKLRGDLQTREREVYHSKQSEELAKFKADLTGASTKAKAAETLYEARLGDAERDLKQNVKEQKKES